MKWYADQIEVAVARHLDWRQNLIVPNVFWGLPGLHYEADMVVVRSSGWAWEIEIKVRAADIVADGKKRHHHDSWWFQQLWFAVPSELSAHPAIPAQAGILAVAADRTVTAVRAARRNEHARKFSPADQYRLAVLGTMRIWSLKDAHQYRRLRDAEKTETTP